MPQVKRDVFSVRVTSDGVRDLEKLTQLSLLVPMTKALVVAETGEATEKLHVHMLLHTVGEYTDTQIRNILKKIYGVGGDGLSCKDPGAHGGTVEKCVQYLCKGSSTTALPEVVLSRGYTEDDVRHAHEVYWALHQQLGANRKNQEGKPMSIYELVRDCCASAKGPDAVAELAVAWYIGRPQGVNYLSFRDAVRKVILENSGPADREVFKMNLLRELNM